MLMLQWSLLVDKHSKMPISKEHQLVAGILKIVSRLSWIWISITENKWQQNKMKQLKITYDSLVKFQSTVSF
jgi:hypothetical protein